MTFLHEKGIILVFFCLFLLIFVYFGTLNARRSKTIAPNDLKFFGHMPKTSVLTPKPEIFGYLNRFGVQTGLTGTTGTFSLLQNKCPELRKCEQFY